MNFSKIFASESFLLLSIFFESFLRLQDPKINISKIKPQLSYYLVLEHLLKITLLIFDEKLF